MPTAPEGFTYRERKSGEVEVLHVGKLAALLRGRQAEKFRERAAGATDGELQHLMARVTGNYKRGNERETARGRFAGGMAWLLPRLTSSPSLSRLT